MVEKSLEAQFYQELKRGNTKKALYIVKLMRNNINTRFRGRSPLSWAKKFENDDVAKALEEKGAIEDSISEKEEEKLGENLRLAAERGDVNAIEMLVEEGADVEARGFNRVTPLMKATDAQCYGDVVIKKLVELGAEIDARDSYGQTALMHAVKNKRMYFVKELIKAGADVFAKDNMDRNLLHIASGIKDNDYMVGELLKLGLDINAKNNKGDSALMTAIFNRDIMSFNVLMAGKPDLNQTNNDGNTYLMVASRIGFLSGVVSLIEAGADVNMRNNEGKNAISLACGDEIRRAIINTVKRKYQNEPEKIVALGKDFEM